MEHEPDLCRGTWGYIYVLVSLYGFTLFAFEAGWWGRVCLCVHRFVPRLWITRSSGWLEGDSAALFGACFPAAGCVG